MSDGSGFTTMAGAKATGEAPKLNIGMLGYAFMGKAHSNAYKTIPYMMYPPVAIPVLAAICGRNEVAVAEAAKRYGYAKYYTDWRDMVADDSIDVFDNGTPNNMHAEPTIAAAKAGKHVFCEKPLAATLDESRAMLEAVEAAGVKNMVAYNYRFVPALRQAFDLIQSGALGKIYHFRAQYLQEWVLPHYNMGMTWRLDKKVAGAGALGDLGAHLIDMGRWLVGEVETVGAMGAIFIPERKDAAGNMVKVDLQDAFVTSLRFANGAIGTLEATRFAAGHKNYAIIEINGEYGSIAWNLERMNELDVYWVDQGRQETRGFANVLISEPFHPFWENWWPQGHMIGWEHTFIHELNHFLDCIVNDKDVAPYGATFRDGYMTDCIVAAIQESMANKKFVDVVY